jgi:transposase
MKTMKLSKQIRDKVVKKYRSGLGYKKRSEILNILRSTITSIIKTLKEYGNTTNLPREGCTPKPTDQERRALIREATKTPKITLNELQSSTAEIGVAVHRTTLSGTFQSWALRKSGQKKSHCLKRK